MRNKAKTKSDPVSMKTLMEQVEQIARWELQYNSEVRAAVYKEHATPEILASRCALFKTDPSARSRIIETWRLMEDKALHSPVVLETLRASLADPDHFPVHEPVARAIVQGGTESALFPNMKETLLSASTYTTAPLVQRCALTALAARAICHWEPEVEARIVACTNDDVREVRDAATSLLQEMVKVYPVSDTIRRSFTIGGAELYTAGQAAIANAAAVVMSLLPKVSGAEVPNTASAHLTDAARFAGAAGGSLRNIGACRGAARVSWFRAGRSRRLRLARHVPFGAKVSHANASSQQYEHERWDPPSPGGASDELLEKEFTNGSDIGEDDPFADEQTSELTDRKDKPVLVIFQSADANVVAPALMENNTQLNQ